MNISLILTSIRLILSPLIVPLIFFQAAISSSWSSSVFWGLILSLLSLTDFLDGYLARKQQQVTTLGAALDPLADKIFLLSALLSLLALQRIDFFWVLILLIREMLVMGVRMIALELSISIPVSKGGKLKTAIQLIYLIYMVSIPITYGNNWWFLTIKSLLLTVSAFLSVFSGIQYIGRLIKQLKLYPAKG